MILNNFYEITYTCQSVESVILSFKILEDMLDSNLKFLEIDFFSTKVNFDMKVYRYYKKTEENTYSYNEKVEPLDYVIGLKKTPFMIRYHITHMDGKVITAKTNSSSHVAQGKGRRSKLALPQMLLYLAEDLRTKIPKDSPTVLHIHDFKEHEILSILKSITDFSNVKIMILTSTNPHNGCRPPKVKTSKPRKLKKITMLGDFKKTPFMYSRRNG